MNAKLSILIFTFIAITQSLHGQSTVGISGGITIDQLHFANNQLYYIGINDISTNIYTFKPSDKYSLGYNLSFFLQQQIAKNLIFEMGITQSAIKDKIIILESFDPAISIISNDEYNTLLNNYGQIQEFELIPGFFYPVIEETVNEINEIDINIQTFNIPLSIIYTPTITPKANLLFKTGLTAKILLNEYIDTSHEFYLYDIDPEKAYKLVQTSFDLGIGYRYSFSNAKYIDLLFQTSMSLYPISNISNFKPYEDLPSIDIPPIKRRSFGIQVKYFFREI